jgi:hypothetical protein
MSNNLGPGVSRVLDPAGTEFTEVIWQAGRPPCDAELNLLQEIATTGQRRVVMRGTPSGWLLNETGLVADFVTDPTWSNRFVFGRQKSGEVAAFSWAVVNGWMVPVGGTRTGTPPGSPNDVDVTNIVALDPPPSNAGDARIDFVFLEVWQARLAPNPSTTNKPSAAGLWRYGNVEGGFSFLPDNLQDPAIGSETSQRVQTQYRLRVVKGLVGFTSYPDGFDPAVVKAQGAATSPTSYTFANMRQALGDPGLWRAGDGTPNALGTVDGYVYAVPICAVFRRNSVAWAGDPSQNLNGGFSRNPTAVDRTGARVFGTVAQLAADLSATATSLTLVSATGIPLPASPATPVAIQIGDEVMTYASITGTTVTGLARGAGVAGCRAEAHKAGTLIRVLPGRPDGLFADQVVAEDILDLRHAVNPAGFDYQALLKGNLDRLLRGQLRAGWKRSGSGPQGPVVLYQDKVSTGAAALGVTKVDGPDNIRQVFSDAAVPQKVYAIVAPSAAGLPAPVGVAWSLSLQVNQTTRATASQFNPGDVFQVPVAQLKAGLPGGDADQVRWMNDTGLSVALRLDGQTDDLPQSAYTVTPASPTPNDDLVITLSSNFPGAQTGKLLMELHVQYGPGRGLSRRPDMLHSVEYVSPSTDVLTQQPKSIPSSTFPTRVTHPMLWAKYHTDGLGPQPPVVTETYVDPGSKTLILNPLRRIDMPDSFVTLDGTAANTPDAGYRNGLTGSTNGSTTFTDGTGNFTVGVSAGDTLVVTGGPQPGRYTVVQVTGAATLTLDRVIPTSAGPVGWILLKGQGLMPLLKRDGVTSKWATTDPLGLFCGVTDPTAATKNLYVQMPRFLVPGWGEYRLPLLWQDQGIFAEGINYGFLTGKGPGPYPASLTNYVPFSNGALTFGLFSTVQLQDPVPLPNPATYNTKYTVPVTYAGMRKFTDPRGLGRKGLELPPFYGVARLWAVYEANDYKTNGSAYDPTSRAATGSLTAAKNLLRQNVQGPLFWVELDEDGDSTFILNAEALDLTKSTNYPITSFDNASANFVIEASLFGFDRGTFDTQSECRIVLTRSGSSGYMRSEAVSGTRASNIGAAITGPVCVLPGPPTGSDQVTVTFSRTPYQGDAWGSQTSYQDIGYVPGCLLSATAYQVGSTTLTPGSLTRPNQKSLEVLAVLDFATTSGTGRMAGSSHESNAFPEYVGYEDRAVWPPTSAIAARPRTLLGALSGDASLPQGTSYIGCTERLPMGALYRDKDFHGQSFTPGQREPVLFFPADSRGWLMGLRLRPSGDAMEIFGVETSAAGGTTPGDVVVQVDGEQGNYSLLTNYRTLRGGSAFAAGGVEVAGRAIPVGTFVTAPRANLLAGRALLVRNTVTSVGSTEVSAGDELMMMIVTTAWPLTGPDTLGVLLSTNGTMEGWSASDLYRIEGRPLVSDNVQQDIDPAGIPLGPVLYRKL